MKQFSSLCHTGCSKKFCWQKFLGAWVLCLYIVGRDEKMIREYIRNQQTKDRRFDQLDPSPLNDTIEKLAFPV